MRNKVNYLGLLAGGAGNPKSWKIITASDYDLNNRKVAAFMNIDTEDEGSFSSVKEEVVEADGKNLAVIEEKDAAFLANTYPFGISFEGVYTELVPSGSSKFKVWFLTPER